MSTILEALRKVEAQRDVPPTADVGDLHEERAFEATVPAKSGTRRVATVAAAAGLSALAGVLVTLGALSLWQDQADLAVPTTVAAAGGGDGAPPSVAATAATPRQEVFQLPPPVAAAGVDAASKPQGSGNRDVVVVADVLAARERSMAHAADTRVGALDESPAPATSSRAFDPESATSRARLKAAHAARVSNVAVSPSSSASSSPSAKTSPRDVAKPEHEERIAVRPIAKAPTQAEASQGKRQRVATPLPTAPKPVIARGETVTKTEIKAPLPRATVTKPVPAPVQVAALRQPRASAEGAPKIAVLGTKWHPRVDRRSAEITLSDGEGTRTIEVREGQRVGSLEVVEIAPTGATFRHKGAEIKRRVGAGPG
jgi:hypothetical protein